MVIRPRTAVATTSRAKVASEKGAFEPTFNKSERTISTLPLSIASSITRDTGGREAASSCVGRYPEVAPFLLEEVSIDLSVGDSRDVMVPAFITIPSIAADDELFSAHAHDDDDPDNKTEADVDPAFYVTMTTAEELGGSGDTSSTTTGLTSRSSTQLFEPHFWTTSWRENQDRADQSDQFSSSSSFMRTIASEDEQATRATFRRHFLPMGSFCDDGVSLLDERDDSLRLDPEFGEQCSLPSLV